MKSLSYRTFSACSKLKTITLQEGTIELSGEAIYSCKVLREIYIPASVTTIGKHAVIGCPKVSIHGKAKSNTQKYAKKDKINFVAE